MHQMLVCLAFGVLAMNIIFARSSQNQWNANWREQWLMELLVCAAKPCVDDSLFLYFMFWILFIVF